MTYPRSTAGLTGVPIKSVLQDKFIFARGSSFSIIPHEEKLTVIQRKNSKTRITNSKATWSEFWECLLLFSKHLRARQLPSDSIFFLSEKNESK